MGSATGSGAMRQQEKPLEAVCPLLLAHVAESSKREVTWVHQQWQLIRVLRR